VKDDEPLSKHLGNLLLLLVCACVSFRPLASGFSSELGSAHLLQLLVFFCGLLWVLRGALSRTLPYRSVGVAIAALAFLLVCILWTLLSTRKLPAVVTLISWTSDIVLLLVLLQSSDRTWRRTVLCCLVASAVVAACIGITQYMWGLDELRESIRNNPEAVKRQLGLREEMWQTFMDRANTDRAFGTFVYPNALAGFLDIVLPVAVGMLAGALLQSKRPVRPGDVAKSGAASAASFVFLLLICLWFTFSKGGWIAAAAALGFMAVRRGKSARARTAVCAALAAALTVLLVVGSLSESVPGPSQYLASLSVRVDYWKAAWRMSLDNRLVGGVGLRNFGDFYPAYKEPSYQEVKLAHGTPMQLLADMGVFGLLAYAALWLLLLKGASGREPDEESGTPPRRGVGLAAGAAVFLMLLIQRDISPFTNEAGGTDLVRWLSYAILWAVSFLALERTVRPDSPAVRLGLLGGCVGYLVHGTVDFDMFVPGIHLTALTAAACAYGLPARERHLGPTARSLLLAGCFAAALTMLAVIRGMTPLPDLLAGESRKKEAHYHICRGDRIKALESLRKSAEANPLDDEVFATQSMIYWRMWTKGTKAFEGRNTRRLATEAALAAARANPRSSTHRAQLARIAASTDIEEAVSHAEEAVGLYPANPHLRVLLGDMLARAGGKEDAARQYEEALRLDGLVMEPWLRIPEAERPRIVRRATPADP
jgi:tetratricopeptide (TPR) repeat protein